MLSVAPTSRSEKQRLKSKIVQEILEERLTSLFQPDTLLSLQYYKIFRSTSQLEPEKRLMLAVLEDAVACFQNYIFARDRKGKLMSREAEEWIFEENSDGPFSFEAICEALGFDPKYTRQGLMRWKEKKLAERPKATVCRFSSQDEEQDAECRVRRTGRKAHKSSRRTAIKRRG